MIRQTERNYQLDNMKAFLIFCVVFGHLLESFGGLHRQFIYMVIYSFHMPAFSYTTGYFARPRPRYALTHILYPYLLYQTLYLCFQRYVLHQPTTFQYTTPYWLLWYLMAYFFWMLLLPIFEGVQTAWQPVAVAAVTLVALLAGRDPTVGYSFSISRMVVFYPFFLLGYYRIPDRIIHRLGKRTTGGLAVVILAGGVLLWSTLTNLPVSSFYQSSSYFSDGQLDLSLLWIRFFSLAAALVWVLMLQTVMPKCRIPAVSALGKYTMSVFLLHGFVIRWIQMRSFFVWNEATCILVAFLGAVLLCALLGNSVVFKLFSFTFSFPIWLQKRRSVQHKS